MITLRANKSEKYFQFYLQSFIMKILSEKKKE